MVECFISGQWRNLPDGTCSTLQYGWQKRNPIFVEAKVRLFFYILYYKIFTIYNLFTGNLYMCFSELDTILAWNFPAINM